MDKKEKKNIAQDKSFESELREEVENLYAEGRIDLASDEEDIIEECEAKIDSTIPPEGKIVSRKRIVLIPIPHEIAFNHQVKVSDIDAVKRQGKILVVYVQGKYAVDDVDEVLSLFEKVFGHIVIELALHDPNLDQILRKAEEINGNFYLYLGENFVDDGDQKTGETKLPFAEAKLLRERGLISDLVSDKVYSLKTVLEQYKKKQ